MARDASRFNSTMLAFSPNKSMMGKFSTRAAATSVKSHYHQIPWNSTANITICTLGLLLNVIEIVTLLRKVKKLTIFELYLLSLAFTDSTVLIAVIVFDSIILNMPVHDVGYIDTVVGLDMPSKMPALRILIEAAKRFSGSSSTVIVFIIGLDRLTATWFPLKHRVWMTKKKAYKIITSSLSICLLFSLLEMTLSFTVGLTVKKYWSKIDACLILTMAFVFSVLYTLIVCKVVERSKIRQKYMGNSCTSNSARSAVEETEVIITCCLVVLAYDVCMLPFAIETLLQMSHEAFYYVFVALYMNAVLDPLIYFFKGFLTKQLRYRRKQMLLRKISEGKLNKIQQQSSLF